MLEYEKKTTSKFRINIEDNWRRLKDSIEFWKLMKINFSIGFKIQNDYRLYITF